MGMMLHRKSRRGNGILLRFGFMKTASFRRKMRSRRTKAVNELKNYDCEQSRSILTNLAIHDSVFAVKEAAFRAAQSMKITKNGQPIRLNRKPKGNLVKGINGKLVTVRNSLPEGYTLDEFKKAFQERYPVAYDIYDGNKGERLDKWLENVIKSLPKTK